MEASQILLADDCKTYDSYRLLRDTLLSRIQIIWKKLLKFN